MIRILSKDTIDKIAAGEVVDRPENVVKELVDNAVDSGADAISVEIRSGGIDLIRVTDNGSGIEKEDIRTAFIRHATSKLTDASGLSALTTMGFRGEALASIAGVARVEMITRTENDLSGVRYLIEGGNEICFQEIGVPAGTTILVRDLFYNIPVRKKFLKNSRTEGGLVRETVEKAALSYPAISFTFLSDGKTVFHTSGNGKLKDMIYTVFGPQITSEMIPVHSENADFCVDGFISAPSLTKARKDSLLYFINHRAVRSRVIDQAILDAYEGLLMQHRYPYTVLQIRTDPAFLDVNIHPKKTEVRFSDDDVVFDFIRHAIRNALVQKERITEIRPEKTEASVREEQGKYMLSAGISEKPEERQTAARKDLLKAQRTEPFEVHLREITGLRRKEEPSAENETADSGTFVQETLLNDPRFLSTSARPYYRFLGQIFETYWLIEYQESLYIIDQHAAHEKVKFEKLMKQITEKEVLTQNIFPVLISLPFQKLKK